ncbi:MAG TPA: hypothetical protein P5056_03560 [Candidatus Paceibacterota bacterium]|nr:hypothetical protein [Candidatus Paceibacterota bacterium]
MNKEKVFKILIKKSRLNTFSVLLSSSLFISSALIFPIYASASTLPMGNSAGIDQAKQFLETIRTQIKFNLPTQDAAAAQIQSLLEQNLVSALGNIDGLGQKLESASSIINLANSVNKGNFSTIIPQILSQASNLQGLQGITNIGSITNQIQSLSSKIPGLSSSLGTINKDLANLSNVNSVVSNLSTKLNNVTSVAGNMQSALQTGASRTALGSYVSSGLDANGLTADEAARYASYEEYWNGLESAWNETDSALAGAASLGDINSISSNFSNANAAGMDSGQQTVCKPNSANNKAGGNGNGVPTIEQEGPLLDYTGQLVNYTAKIKAINEETCKLVEQLYKKEFELDKKATEDAQKAVAEAKKEFEKQFAEGRKPANDLSTKKSSATTPKELEGEEKEAVRNNQINNLKNTSISKKYQDVLSEELKKQNEIEKDDNAAYAARVAPTFDTDKFFEDTEAIKKDDYFSKLSEALYPKNTLIGQYFIQMAEKQRAEEEAVERARTEYIAGQGIIGVKQCIKEITTEDGKTSCLDWQVTIPAKTYGDLASAYFTDNYKQTSGVKEDSDKANIPAAQQDVQVIATAGGAAGGGGTGGNTTSSNTSGGTSEANTTNPTNNQNFNLEDLLNQIGEGSSEENQGETSSVSIPLPTISFSAEKASPVNGVSVTRISWSADLALSCRAANNWIWYSDKATTTRDILVKQDADRSLDGNVPIYHPAAFSFSATVTGNDRLINIPQAYTLSIVKEGTGFKQTVRYEPNITAELLENDVFNIKINNDLANDPTISILFTDGMTKSELVSQIISVMNNTDQATDAGKIYKGIAKEKSADGNALILTKSVSNVPATADYEIACKNITDKETTKKITIEFFK